MALPFPGDHCVLKKHEREKKQTRAKHSHIKDANSASCGASRVDKYERGARGEREREEEEEKLELENTTSNQTTKDVANPGNQTTNTKVNANIPSREG
jgi:hypothetical protein